MCMINTLTLDELMQWIYFEIVHTERKKRSTTTKSCIKRAQTQAYRSAVSINADTM